MNQLLRRAWDALDAFKQAYPEYWNDEDQQVADDLLKADLDLSGIKREWVGLTPTDMEELSSTWWQPNENEMALIDWVEAKLKEKNT